MLGDKNMSVNSLLAFILHEKDGGVVLPVIVGNVRSERGRYCIAITPQQLLSIGLVSSTFSLRATERNHLGTTTSIRTLSSSLEDPHERLVPHLFFSIYMALYALPQASSFKFTD